MERLETWNIYQGLVGLPLTLVNLHVFHMLPFYRTSLLTVNCAMLFHCTIPGISRLPVIRSSPNFNYIFLDLRTANNEKDIGIALIVGRPSAYSPLTEL